ncbi:hypothetical protein [Halomonas sp. M4R1S46]|uniref:hypothetical protein n=1 Tax=Halomonas sp. M4R1S46 TaxID=2982692 RepID=UPI0021E43F76|nr:hypothetical protein [Halomonas sp. M4R1S46]UYG09353.1 hypothetical protein OCT48_08505 [Halomonas sp. M4R1S46]
MDEREKLRKFRELDDAFAEALKELENPDSRLDIPTGPPVRSLEAQERPDGEAVQQAFERRLKALMQDYAQPAESVSRLLETLRSLGHIA